MRKRLPHLNRSRTLLLSAVLLAALAVVSSDALLARPVRTWAERTINSSLKGYTVRIKGAHPHIWKLGLDLDNLSLIQNRHPQPPVADIGALRFTLHWRALLHSRLAGDLDIRRPDFHINLAQIQEEESTRTTLKDQGWQRAVEAIYPFKLDQVRIEDGGLLYLAAAPTSKPLRLTQVTMVAKNIRNQSAARDTFPSPVTLEARLFDSGKIGFRGAADFLREPFAAALGEIHLERVPLDRLTPVAQDYNLKTTGGLLSADGNLEYTAKVQKAHLQDVLFEGLRVDYVTTRATKAREQKHAQEAVQLARQVRDTPQLSLQVDALRLSHSELGFVDEGAVPPYRLFMSDVNMQVDNLNNQANQGRSRFQARGTFMGSGRTEFAGGFLATANPADFAVRLQLNDAKLTDLNRYFLSQKGVDVADGLFSVYSEITVKGGRLEGYLKPMVRNLKVSDKRKDQDKPWGKRVEMHVLQGLGNLFKNRSTRQVATVTRISGSTSDPKVGTWQAVAKALGNGLFRAILPGFQDKDLKKSASAAPFSSNHS